MAVKIATEGVAGYYIQIPDIAPLLIDALLASLIVGTGIPDGCRDNAFAAYFVFEN